MYPVVDLFAGPGGLGEGFASCRLTDGNLGFDLVLSIEQDRNAAATLRLRNFLHRLEGDRRVYQQFYETGSGVDDLYASNRKVFENAESRTWQHSLSPETAMSTRQRIQSSLAPFRGRPWVLVGGPPCQAYSLVGRSRNRGIKSYCAEDDARQTLYVEYLQVIGDHAPDVFVMENVKGLQSAKLNGNPLFERILCDLENPADALKREGRRASRRPKYNLFGLSPDRRDSLFQSSALSEGWVVRAEDHGCPQARHRVFIVGVRRPNSEEPARLKRSDQITVRDSVARLPALRSMTSGRNGNTLVFADVMRSLPSRTWLKSLPGNHRELVVRAAASALALDEKAGVGPYARYASGRPSRHEMMWRGMRMKIVRNHEPRSHMPSDLERYMFAAVFAQLEGRSPKLDDFPEGLLPNHKNADTKKSSYAFADRFRVQLFDRPSTTVTSHIAKDGHYYIHPAPEQCRSLTVREAARLQTFPDDYLFLGNRTQQYHQVGNAVPPHLSRQIAATVLELLD